jgi:oxalate---CoA ligase
MFPDIGRCGSIEDGGLGVRWEAATLAHEVARRAAILAQRRIGPGSVVAISHSGSAHFFADLFAVWTVGAAAACLDSTLTAPELQTVIDFVNPVALLVGRSRTPHIPAVPVLELAESRTSAGLPDLRRVKQPAPDLPALLLFTSGTTGSPKGVVLTYRALQTRVGLNIAAIGAAALRRTLVTLPTHFGHGLIGNALTPLLSGGDIVLYPPGSLLGDQLGRIIDKHGITFLTSVPTFWNLVRKSSDPPARDSLLRVHVGSAPLSAKLWSEIAAWSRAEVTNCFGMTETANWIAGASSRTDGIADGLVGRPWGGKAAVVGDDGVIHPSGAGEILVQSPSLTSGYFNRPDLTAAVMMDGWFRTGDRGTIDDLGRIWLTGRIKDEINRAGFKVQPAEIDMVIEAHPAVAEACVFGIPDPISGEIIGAAVRLAQQDGVDAHGLEAWCRERLRRGAVPERWFMVESIPRNVRGKVNRDAVRRRLLDVADALKFAVDAPQTLAGVSVVDSRKNNSDSVKNPSPVVPPVTRVVAVVEQAWTRLLGQRSFLANTPWDQAGGDSIGAMRLWLQIEEQLAVTLPLEHLEFNATPKKLIGVIERLLETSDQASVIIPLRLQQPMIFLLPPAHGDTVALTRFRAALHGRVHFEVIRYPQLNEFLDGGAGCNLIVDSAVEQILAKGRRDAYYLAGYSFGGFVAWETARRLLESGHEVRFLGLIDTRLVAPRRERKSFFAKAAAYIWRRLKPKLQHDQTAMPRNRTAVEASGFSFWVACKSFWGACKAACEDVLAWLYETLARKCSRSLLRQVNRFAKALPVSAAITFELELIARLRSHAFQRITIEPLDVTATLFRSDEFGETPDYGWGKLCKRLMVLPIDGGHLSLFDSKYREALCARFQHAVEAAITGGSWVKMSKTGS